MDAKEKGADRHRRLTLGLLSLGLLEYSLTDAFLQGGLRLFFHSVILFAIAVMAGELTRLNVLEPRIEEKVQQRLREMEEEKKDEKRNEGENKL